MSNMTKEILRPYKDGIIEAVNKHLPTNQEDWMLLGFINPQNKIYTFGNDSKIIGRLFKVLAAKFLSEAASDLSYTLGESEKQTVYPDFYFIKPDGRKIAIDVKITYRRSDKAKYKFTSGSFTSFMRNGTKNIYGNYGDYDSHYILGIVYTRKSHPTTGTGHVDNIKEIIPAYNNVECFIQEKFKICGESKGGSGNTDNIGTISSNSLAPFVYGAGPFSFLGKNVFHDFGLTIPNIKTLKR